MNAVRAHKPVIIRVEFIKALWDLFYRRVKGANNYGADHRSGYSSDFVIDDLTSCKEADLSSAPKHNYSSSRFIKLYVKGNTGDKLALGMLFQSSVMDKPNIGLLSLRPPRCYIWERGLTAWLHTGNLAVRMSSSVVFILQCHGEMLVLCCQTLLLKPDTEGRSPETGAAMQMKP